MCGVTGENRIRNEYLKESPRDAEIVGKMRENTLGCVWSSYDNESCFEDEFRGEEGKSKTEKKINRGNRE